MLPGCSGRHGPHGRRRLRAPPGSAHARRRGPATHPHPAAQRPAHPRSFQRLHGRRRESPPYMVEGVRFLERAGAQLIAIPCNTAHLWYDDIAAATQRPVLHIIQAVIDDLRRLGLQQGRIGLMGTAATLKLGLYQRHLEAQGYECIVPDDDEVERYCMASIRAVKGNQLEAAFAPAADCIARLKARGADAVVLGCTELPLAVPHALRPSLGITLTDSIDALARAAIAHYLADQPEQRIAA
ncbi:amino acid racemase [Achromobacter xylosoxidans]